MEEKQKLVLWDKETYKEFRRHIKPEANIHYNSEIARIKREISGKQIALRKLKLDKIIFMANQASKTYTDIIIQQRQEAQSKGWDVAENDDSKDIQ